VARSVDLLDGTRHGHQMPGHGCEAPADLKLVAALATKAGSRTSPFRTSRTEHRHDAFGRGGMPAQCATGPMTS
jgi:hypothetical protein